MLADEVFAWLSQQPLWQQDLARRLATQVDLDEVEYDDALAMIKGAFAIPQNHPAPTPWPIRPDDMALSAAGGAAQLLALGGLQGVGLVAETEQLTFAAAGLTVIYGQNGAGKSTYVKTLKKLCRTVDLDCKIRGNIYDSRAPLPSVKIKVAEGGEVWERRTPLDGTGVVRLAGMSVFDSACAELYVDEQNTLQYVPTEVRLLARLASLQDRMRKDLAAELGALEATRPAVDAYPATTGVGQSLRRLTGLDSDPDLTPLATLSETAAARRDELRGAIAAAATSTSAADAAAAARDAGDADALIATIKALHARVGLEAVEKLRAAADRNQQAQAAVKLAAEQLRGPYEGMGASPWQALWDAARSFVEGTVGVFPPVAGQACPLCLQPVTDETAARMAHFDQHVKSTVQTAAGEHAAAFEAALAAAAPAHAAGFARDPLLVALRQREPELGGIVDHVISRIAAHLDTMIANPSAAEAAKIDMTPVVSALVEWGSGRACHAETLRAADNAETLPALRAELEEFEARDRLHGELDTFLAWRHTQLVLRAIGAAQSALATNKITTAQRVMTENEVGKALDAALTTELTRLACALPVQLRTHTARAQTSVGLRLLAANPVRVSEIASEGERRALALCFFFAELEIANDLGGVVLDDPVSSLDDERRLYIAHRLVTEASKRQVIVFTHDLPFVFELRAAAKKACTSVHVQHVWRQGSDVGRVDEHPPFKTMNLKQRIARLDEEVQALKGAPAVDSDEAWRQVEGFYKRVRTSWERAVEERMFAGVVERFERDVKTLLLKDVKTTPDLIKQVDDGTSNASRYIHEDAYAAQVPLPSITQLAEDVEGLRRFEKETRQS